MICQTYLYFTHFTPVAPSLQAAWVSCFVLESVRLVRVSSLGWRSRQSQTQQAEGNTDVEGSSFLLLMMGQVCSNKLISRVVAACLGLIYSETTIIGGDCRNRLHGWSPGLLTFAVTYPVITRYRKMSTLWHPFHWLSTGNVWARAWRKLVHHQRILTGWKSRTPLHPGCMTLASSNPANSPVYQSTHIIYLFQCSSVLLDITAASPCFISAKLPLCFPCYIEDWSRRIGFLKVSSLLNQP